MASSPIPTFYHILFTWLDPLGCFFGAFTHLFQAPQTLVGYSPTAALPPTSESLHMLDTIAGFYLFLGLLEATLFRARSRDAVVWRFVEGCAFFVDLFMVYAAVQALRLEGRMDVGSWRGDDYRLVVGNAVAGLLRAGCALGVGFGAAAKEKKR